MNPPHETFLPVSDYNLDATLDSGQAFRWQIQSDGSWTGILGHRCVQLRGSPQGIHATTWSDPDDWEWLKHYLQCHVCLGEIIQTFPQDEPLRQSVAYCRGLRLLRQEPWECLASFILSSTKQIPQIKQIIQRLAHQYGAPIPGPTLNPPAYAFPTPERIASLSEAQLRECKMGFRAPSLLEAARRISEGHLDLNRISSLPLDEARLTLCQLRGVGPKIADCVLLFAFPFPNAFPIDVWVQKALQQLYFKGRKIRNSRLHSFTQTHFGPHAGYAQQYLFHYMRTQPSPNAP